MKRFLLVVALVVLSVGLFAQITPYGSARVGYWFNMYDEDHRLGERTVNDFMLQNNSRFGVNYRNADQGLTARVEFGAGTSNVPSLRLLWARQQFDGWSLLVGQDNDGTNIYSNQTWSTDYGLIGYGAVDGGRNPMVRFRMDNGFYLAAMPAKTGSDPAGNNGGIDALIPRVNLGYDAKLMDGNLELFPTFVFQTYGYNKDFGNGHDGNVMSWLGAVTAVFKADALTLTGHFNLGSNTGNMGYRFGSASGIDANPNRARWDGPNNETEDAMTLGGFLMVGYDVSSTFNINGGFGFASTSRDDFDNDSVKMGCYLQGTLRAGRLRITPELGMMMEGDNYMNDPQNEKMPLGNTIYAGTQLRFDF